MKANQTPHTSLGSADEMSELLCTVHWKLHKRGKNKRREETAKSESEGSALHFYMLRALSSLITKQLLQSLFKQFSSRVTSSKWEEAKRIRGW